MNKYFEYIKKNFALHSNSENNEYKINIRNNEIVINQSRWFIKNFKNFDRENIFSLKVEENWSVLILVLKLLEKGYSSSELYLEKKFLVGHDYKYLDVGIYNRGKPFAFIEVKKPSEISKYTKINTSKNNTNPKQVFSYIWQEQWAKVASYYTFDIESQKHCFFNVFIDEILKKANSVEELFDFWNKSWDTSSVFEWDKFRIKFIPLQYKDLKPITKNDVNTIFYQFLTILRQNTVSDRSNAFDKLINIFMIKVFDEINETSDVVTSDETFKGLQFQYIEDKDDDISFLKRLNNMYKVCMKYYMNKDIIDYTDDEIDDVLSANKDEKIREIIDNLRLKKNNAFAFIEVFDDKTFKENALILREIVKLFQGWKFKYPNKYQYLGDFFEKLLNTSWKQEAGQFFTPMPIVDFMVNSLPIKEKLDEYIRENNPDFMPKMIDYACGAGHFLVSYMDKMQNILNNYSTNKSQYKRIINGYKENPFTWVENSVVGIEKDYRLAKTTKISSYLNGDGVAKIINGDGINRFDSNDYKGSILYADTAELEKFDFVIANPPFSVSGFMKNIKINEVTENDFKLLRDMSYMASEIEVLFVERTWQLLKKGGYASIILPRSILFNSQYSKMRDFILKNFKIKCLCEFGEKTFGCTPTNPVILFLKKQNISTTNYNILSLASPLFYKEKSKSEWEFLGYKFSSSKNKTGIVLQSSQNNLPDNYAPIINDFIQGKYTDVEHKIKNNKYFNICNLANILCPDEDGNKNLIFTHFNNNRNGFATLGEIMNEVDFSINPDVNIDCQPDFFDENGKIIKDKVSNIPYIEIGDIKNGKIVKQNNKKESGTRVIMPGDLVIGSVCPSAKNIAISDKMYRCKSTIIVIRSMNGTFINNLYKYLINNTNDIWNDIWITQIGFKMTYGKISDNNMINVLLFEKAKLI